MSEDRRIQIGGSAQISGSQIASGEHITQTQHTHESPLDQAIAHISALLDQHAAELPQADRARRDLDDIRAEIAEADPDQDRISDTLQRLGTRVAGVAALAEAIGALAAMITT